MKGEEGNGVVLTEIESNNIFYYDIHSENNKFKVIVYKMDESAVIWIGEGNVSCFVNLVMASINRFTTDKIPISTAIFNDNSIGFDFASLLSRLLTLKLSKTVFVSTSLTQPLSEGDKVLVQTRVSNILSELLI